MSRFIACGLVLLLSSGCAGFVDRAIDKGQRIKDDEAQGLKAAVCAMSIGAYHRQNTVDERAALDVLCGGLRMPELNKEPKIIKEDETEFLS